MSVILFGAGAAGRYAQKFLCEKGEEPIAFADNNSEKWGTHINGIGVFSPTRAFELWPDAEWVASAISRPSATEIRAQMAAMGVNTKPLWECLPVCHGVPSQEVLDTLDYISAGDKETREELYGQKKFRMNPNYDTQTPPSPMSELYFPEFIKRLDNEYFVDCGAADGDTIKVFIEKWEFAKNTFIIAFEPDAENYQKIIDSKLWKIRTVFRKAVSDRCGILPFTSNGDMSSRLGEGEDSVECVDLDSRTFHRAPTYIKMDIEGSELEALWGARNLIKEHSPVLAICAYHTSDHLWQVPLLIHAINPDYKLYFRRYAEGAFEIVWYAVPPERVI